MNIIQSKELDIFIEVSKILKKRKLRYFAIGGTCIGAVRHNGFIPWDDDIDIAMPREDYEQFRNIYFSELPSKYKKLDYDSCPSNTFLFTKIYDAETTYIENYAKNFPDRYTGVFIDIMPIDGLPKDNDEMNSVVRKANRMTHMNTIVRPWYYDPQTFSQKVKKRVKSIYRIIFSLYGSYNLYSKKVADYLSQFPYDHSEHVFFTWRDECPLIRQVFKADFFVDLIEWPFENTTIMIPKDYDSYLRQDFGDYMKLPPEDEQKTNHSLYLCDLNKPASYYADLKRRALI